MSAPTLTPVTEDEIPVVADRLADLGDQRGGDVVDEGELARLQGRRSRDGWQAVVARDGAGEIIGYAGLVDRDGELSGDVVAADGAEVLVALLEWQRQTAGDRDLVTWLRFATDDELAAAKEAGFEVRRQLGVLGCDLDDVPHVDPPEGVTIRPITNEDLDGVLAVLLDAYDGTPDGGWTMEELANRRAYPWYRDSDMLVAVTRDNRVAGVHWTKRRTPRTGEVYNLAIAPWAQGKGLGRALLAAGMEHVRDTGRSDMLLWVDRDNERALHLYDSLGFTTRWDDVAFG